MHQPINHPVKATNSHMTSIDIAKLPPNTVLMVETKSYLYKLEVLSDRTVQVETGDPRVGDGRLYRMKWVEEEQPLCFQSHDGMKMTDPVTHCEVSGVGQQGPWSYEVF